jgi:hypothetical protein
MCYFSVKGQVRVTKFETWYNPDFKSVTQNGSPNESKTLG